MWNSRDVVLNAGSCDVLCQMLPGAGRNESFSNLMIKSLNQLCICKMADRSGLLYNALYNKTSSSNVLFYLTHYTTAQHVELILVDTMLILTKRKLFHKNATLSTNHIAMYQESSTGHELQNVTNSAGSRMTQL